MVDWDDVREIALSFPEVEESGEDRVAFRVRGKLFAWAARERDGGGLGIRVDREEKQLILDSNPDVYFSSPHYDGWPGVQIRLEADRPGGAADAARGRMAHPGPEEAGGGLRHRDRLMHDWDTVREIAGTFPGAEESTTYGKPAFKVGGKLFTWISPDRHAGDALAVRVDPDEKELLLEAGRRLFPDAALRRPSDRPDPARAHLARAARGADRGRVAPAGAEARSRDAYVVRARG